MKACARVGVIGRGGSTVVETLRSEPPLLLRQTPACLMLVGGAAGPLTGDDLYLSVDVGPGAELAIGSVAASLAQAGPGDPTGLKQSVMRIDVSVGAGASLDWNPQPLISVSGSNHRQHTVIRLHEEASLRWRDTVVFGRSGEGPGAFDSTLRVERQGRAIVHQQLSCPDLDSWHDPTILGGARALINDLHVGRPIPISRADRASVPFPPEDGAAPIGRTEIFAISQDAEMAVALAGDLQTAERLLWCLSRSSGGIDCP